MEKITTILHRRPARFNTISSSASISDALLKMCCENFDHLVVMDNEDFRGVISAHDINTRIIFARKPLTHIAVKEVMNTSLPLSNAEDTVEECMLLMQLHSVRYLPVFEGLNFVGVVSADDLIYETVFDRMEKFDPHKEEPATFD